MNHKQQRGVSIIMAIFLMVVLAGVAGVMARLVATSNIGAAQDVMGAQARQAALAGLDVGIYNWIKTGTCTSSLSVAGYQVSVSCATPPSPITNDTNTLAIAKITSIACSPGGACPNVTNPNRVGYVERKVEASAMR
jgi:MSHA biogenesis protein MshP